MLCTIQRVFVMQRSWFLSKKCYFRRKLGWPIAKASFIEPSCWCAKSDLWVFFALNNPSCDCWLKYKNHITRRVNNCSHFTISTEPVKIFSFRVEQTKTLHGVTFALKILPITIMPCWKSVSAEISCWNLHLNNGSRFGNPIRWAVQIPLFTVQPQNDTKGFVFSSVSLFFFISTATRITDICFHMTF